MGFNSGFKGLIMRWEVGCALQWEAGTENYNNMVIYENRIFRLELISFPLNSVNSDADGMWKLISGVNSAIWLQLQLLPQYQERHKRASPTTVRSE